MASFTRGKTLSPVPLASLSLHLVRLCLTEAAALAFHPANPRRLVRDSFECVCVEGVPGLQVSLGTNDQVVNYHSATAPPTQPVSVTGFGLFWVEIVVLVVGLLLALALVSEGGLGDPEEVGGLLYR